MSASLGEDEKGGIEIALLDRDYQILDHPILLTGEDTLCSPDGGATAGEKLAADPTIVGIIGTSCSSEARAAMPAISQAGRVMISPSNSHPDLTAPTHPDHHAGYFRTYPNDRYQGQVAAEFAYQILGLRRAATISDGGPYSEELIDAFVETFTAMGGQVVAQETVEPNAVDAMPELINIVGKSPQVIYMPLFMNEGKLVATQVKEYGPLQDVSLVTSDMLFSPYFLEQMGQSAEGMYMTGLYENTQNPAYQVFLDKWADQYGDRPPGIYRTHAYVAANLLLDAIEKVAIQMPDGTLYIPRQALRDALYGVRNYPGLTGILNCNENGDCGSPKAFGVYQITQAEIDGSWPPPVFWYP